MGLVPNDFTPMDLARLICIDIGTIKGKYITGVLLKERAEWYDNVLGPAFKWILLAIGGGLAITSVAISAYRCVNEMPMP